MDRFVYSDPTHVHDVLGFKIFYFQPVENNERVWRYFIDRPDIHLIHLWRRNYLRCYVSLEQAKQTDVWIRPIPTAVPPAGVQVDAEHFIRNAGTVEKAREKILGLFTGRPMLSICYEDLVADTDGQMARVYATLGIPFVAAKPVTSQLNKADLPVLIRNYREVADKLRGTKYARFLEIPETPGALRRTSLPPPQPRKSTMLGLGRSVARYRLFSHAGPDDLDIITHFFAHYEAMGVRDFHLILHGPEAGRRLLRKACHGHSVTIEEEYDDQFDETVKCGKLTEHIRKYPGEWVLVADIDEFLELPYPTIDQTVRALRACGGTSLRATMIQRLAADGCLAPLLPGQTAAAVYPLCSAFLSEYMSPDMPPWITKYPLLFTGAMDAIKRGHHLAPDNQPSHLLPISAVVHHFKWRASFFDSLTRRLALKNANAHELHRYHLWLQAHDNRLPCDGSFPYSRAELFARGLLRQPARRERLHAALLARLRMIRSAEPSDQVLRRYEPRLRAMQARWEQSKVPSRPGALPLRTGDLFGRPLRVAMVTFQLSPPDRSAGIGTAFTALAETLARAGHTVTILYVKPLDAFWREVWTARGIELVGLPFDDQLNRYAGLTPTLGHMVNDWLGSRGFDVIHFHDCLGLGALVAAAKRQGLGFQSSTLVVTTHGNTTWHNRGNAYPLTHNELRIDDAEARQLAMADRVASPSAYMFRWLEEHGYVMPAGQDVIPNILSGEVRQPPKGPSAPKPVDELVFFGRLEHRKGLDLFCEAVNKILVAGVTGFKVTFLGSPANSAVKEYITRTAGQWKIPWSQIEGFGISDAIQYLRNHKTLVVMPSRLDNYPYTVLECLGNGIPFLASDVGGTSEMIHPDDRARVVAPLEIEGMARAMTSAILHGHAPARPACDFEDVELQWLAWHGALTGNATFTSAGIRTGAPEKTPDAPKNRLPVSICFTGFPPSTNTFGAFESLFLQLGVDFELIAPSSFLDDPEIARQSSWEQKCEMLRHNSVPGSTLLGPKTGLRSLKNGPDLPVDSYAARANALAEVAITDYLLFSPPSVAADQRMLALLYQAARATGADAVLSSYSLVTGWPSAWKLPERTFGQIHPTHGPLALAPYENVMGGPCFLVRRDVFRELRGFRDDPLLAAFEHVDLLNRLALAGKIITSVPLLLYRDYLGVANFNLIRPPPATAEVLRQPFAGALPRGMRPLLSILANNEWFTDSEHGLALQAFIDWQKEEARNASGSSSTTLLALNSPADLKQLVVAKDAVGTQVTEGLEVVATGYDPILLLPELQFPAGPIELHLECELTCEQPVMAQLFWKESGMRDYDENHCLRYHTKPGFNRIHFVTPFVQPTNHMRFDPGTLPCRYLIKSLVVRAHQASTAQS